MTQTLVMTSGGGAGAAMGRPSSGQDRFPMAAAAVPLPRSRSASPSLSSTANGRPPPQLYQQSQSSYGMASDPLAAAAAAAWHCQQQQAAIFAAQQHPQHQSAVAGGFHPYKRTRAPSAPSAGVLRDPNRPFGVADVDQAYHSLDNRDRRRTSSFNGSSNPFPSPQPPALLPLVRPPREAAPSPSFVRQRTQSSESLPRQRTQSVASTISIPRSASDRSITPTQANPSQPISSASSASSLRPPGSAGVTRTPSPLARPPATSTTSSQPSSPAPVVKPMEAAKPKGLAKFKRAFSTKDIASAASSPSSSSSTVPRTSVTSLSSSETSRASSSPPATPPNLPSPAMPPPRHRLGIFSNSKMNGSTDNLSIQSTMSSASVMLRKIGAFGGKLGKRSSIGSLFKGNRDSADPLRSDAVSELGVASTSKLSKKERKAAQKSALDTASVAHVHVEVDRNENAGISSAAAFARHHQLQYAEKERQQSAPPPRLPSTSSFPDSLSRARNPRGPAPKSKLAPSLPVGDFGTVDLHSLDPNPLDIDSDGSSEDGFAMDENETIGDDAPTPRQSLVVDDPRTVTSAFDDDAASFRGIAGPIVPYVEDPAAIEYDGSVFRAKAMAARRLPSGEVRQVKSILKTRSTPPQSRRPTFTAARIRSDSYDPTLSTQMNGGQTHHGSDPPAIVEAIMSSPSQVDGLGEHVSTGRPFSPYEQPAYNASAPSLVSRHPPSGPHRSVTAPPTERRRIAFAPSLSVHTTWPAHVYNRASEPATCNRLNAELAAAIKAELNSFKMGEMAVHPDSRIYTHFFV